MCLARSLSPLTNGADVVLQVLNISPIPITIYKGMMLAMATPEQCVLLVSPADAIEENLTQSPFLDTSGTEGCSLQ